MSPSNPLVTALIATRNRAPELAQTLEQLRQQDYPNLEVLVIDDFSDQPVEPLVRKQFRAATVIRHLTNTGQCQRRSEGFLLAQGDYILHLDDDCCFVDPSDLSKAVAVMESRPDVAILAPFLYNGPSLPSSPGNAGLSSGFVASFVGAAALIRTASVRQTAGYRTFFGNEWEEEELCLQLLGRGLGVWFEPSLVAHHRLSSLNRNSERTWVRGLRNRGWAILMHMPWNRIPVELSWKFALGAWDAFRLKRWREYFQAITGFISGIGNALHHRRPLGGDAMRRYDAIRSLRRLTAEQFALPPKLGLRGFASWFGNWRNRARDRNHWDKRSGGTGKSYTVGYAHERNDER